MCAALLLLPGLCLLRAPIKTSGCCCCVWGEINHSVVFLPTALKCLLLQHQGRARGRAGGDFWVCAVLGMRAAPATHLLHAALGLIHPKIWDLATRASSGWAQQQQLLLPVSPHLHSVHWENTTMRYCHGLRVVKESKNRWKTLNDEVPRGSPLLSAWSSKP